jgi:hypothetical protein
VGCGIAGLNNDLSTAVRPTTSEEQERLSVWQVTGIAKAGSFWGGGKDHTRLTALGGNAADPEPFLSKDDGAVHTPRCA